MLAVVVYCTIISLLACVFSASTRLGNGRIQARESLVAHARKNKAVKESFEGHAPDAITRLDAMVYPASIVSLMRTADELDVIKRPLSARPPSARTVVDGNRINMSALVAARNVEELSLAVDRESA
jgi:hypothetical protein